MGKRRGIAGSVVFAAFALIDLACKPKPVPAPPPPPTATRTVPATTQAATSQPLEMRSFGQLVKSYYPDCPSTQPLDQPLDRAQGARVRLTDPIYLDRNLNLWITRLDAEPTEEALSASSDHTEHFVRDKPVFAYWRTVPAERRKPIHSTATLICPAEDGKALEFVEETGRAKLKPKAEGYDWPGAFLWGDSIVVGQASGASIFKRTEAGWEESASPALIDDPKVPHARTQMPTAQNGVLAYIPAEAGHAGSKTTLRFADGKWTPLKGDDWPGNFLHLIPLSDGSVLQVVADPPAADHDDANLKRAPKVHLAITPPTEAANVDRPAVMKLIDDLDSRDAETRKAAFQQLAVFGSSLWSIIEDEMPRRPDGVKEKLAELLKNKTDPTLGEMSLVDPRLILAARTSEGGALFYDEGGVSVINVDGDQTLVAPAWISVMPGRPIRLMIGEAWANLTPERKKFFAANDQDWVVVDEAKGPEEIVGTFDIRPILKPAEANFSEFVGIDRHDRWIFRDPTADVPTALILDPNLPPLVPRLPVWEFAAGKEELVGWDEHDWPAYKDKGGDNVWVVDETGFHVQDTKQGKFFFEPSDIPKARAPSPAGKSTTSPATSRPASSQPWNAPLLVQADGTAFFGGTTDLRRVSPTGETTDWPLPLECTGTFARPWLVADKENRLFLFNAGGRIVRLRANPPAAPQPFKVEGTFSHKIPNEEPLRMWIDPANRLIIAHDGNQAAICFPVGVVPAQLADKIPGDATDEADEDE